MRLQCTRTVLAVAAMAFLFGCGSESGPSVVQQDNTGLAVGGGGKQDAGTTDAAAADVEAKSGAHGDKCQGDVQCDSGICFAGTCAQACQAPADCAAPQECTSDDGKRTFCRAPAYDPAIGTPCPISGECPTGLTCLPPAGVWAGSKLNVEAAGTYCSAACTTDADCPGTYFCGDAGKLGTFCQQRSFCSTCLHDGQCGSGRCVQQGGARFCAQACSQGSTECPRFADCVDVGGGDFQCVHKSGTCAGAGDLCSPCNDTSGCAGGGLCLAYTYTKEDFCTATCADGPCPSGYKCESIGGAKHCVPADTKQPRCVEQISPTMEIGDILTDYAMVGFIDTNDDGSLNNEPPYVIRLSDFAESHKVILVTISAGWCGPCQAETKTFKSLLNILGSKGLMIFQVLNDGPQQQSTPTLAFTKLWIKNLNAAGAVGVDPYDDTTPWNTTNGTPLNLIIDAKTRKVLDKFSGVPVSLQNRLAKFL